jgi:hypothetical protein
MTLASGLTRYWLRARLGLTLSTVEGVPRVPKDRCSLASHSLGRRKPVIGRERSKYMWLGSIALCEREKRMKRLPNRALVALVVAAASVLIGWTTVASAETPTVTTQVDKFSKVMHFDAAPECNEPSGTTEYVTGIEHLQVVSQGDTIHVAFDETFWTLEVADDPAIPTRERHGTDAISFNLVDNGAVRVFHESFHETNTVFGDIFLSTTFHAVNGEVLVDHFIGRNLPPEGC